MATPVISTNIRRSHASARITRSGSPSLSISAFASLAAVVLTTMPSSQPVLDLRPVHAQLSHRYASDIRNAADDCEFPRPLSICGAKNCCPSRGRFVLTGSTLMCGRRYSRGRSWHRRTVRPSVFARRTSDSASPTLARVVPKSLHAPQCFDIDSYFFVWWESWVRLVYRGGIETRSNRCLDSDMTFG
jgi:hypothetical protein